MLILLALATGKTADALAIARNVQKQRPKEAIGYLLEGDVRASGKHWTEAIAAYRTGLKQTPSTELAVRLHDALLVSGNATEADKAANEWLKAHPKDAAYRLHLGDIATARKDYPAAAQHYRSVVDQQPENALALNNLAWAAWARASAASAKATATAGSSAAKASAAARG